MQECPSQKMSHDVDEFGRNALWHCAANGNIEQLRSVRFDASEASRPDSNGFTPLHVAAQNGHLDVVQALIEAEANVNAADQYGNAPLWTASRQASLAIATDAAFEIVRCLLMAGADPHHINSAGRSSVVWATRSRRLCEIYAGAGIAVSGSDG